MRFHDPLPSDTRSSILPLLLLLGFLTFASGGCKKDVTNNPYYNNFSAVVGTWKTKTPLLLVEIDKQLYLCASNEVANPSARRLATLPVGTTIRIEHLIRENTIEVGLTYPTGSLTSGPYAGQTIELAKGLFVPNGFLHPRPPTQPTVDGWTFSWKVAPDKLEK